MKKYNIFISHVWDYTEHYCKVEDWLDDARSKCLLAWDNYSVPLLSNAINPNFSDSKKYLKEKLNHQISGASIILILTGMYKNHPTWIEYETLMAAYYGKYVIGIKPWKEEDIPKIIKDNVNVIVEWDKSCIINAILESLTHNMVMYS